MINFTPFMRWYSHFRLWQLKRHNIASVQQKQLFTLLKTALNTQFGRDYDFADIRTIEDYQKQVPLRTYDDFWAEYWQKDFPHLDNITWPGKIPFFCPTSGTVQLTRTANREAQRIKYIPLSWAMIKSNKRGSFDLFCHHLQYKPDSKLLAGKGAMPLFSPIKELAPDIYASFVPTLLFKKVMPSWIKPWHLYIDGLDELPNIRSKLDYFAKNVLINNVRSLSAMPQMLLDVFQSMQKSRDDSGKFLLQEYMPHLELMVHGGMSMRPYQKQFEDLLQNSECDLREIYPSSEGFFAIADRKSGEGLRLIYDHNIFYEFIPLDELQKPHPQALLLHQVEVEVDYALVISTCAGLWRYIIGDVVRFVSLNPPRLLISGRTNQSTAIAGENFLEAELAQALSDTATSLNLAIKEYAIRPQTATKIGERGCYHYLIEFQEPPSTQKQQTFINQLEAYLCQNNALYETAYRYDTIKQPKLYIAPVGSFKAWTISKGSAEGKVPRIWLEEQPFIDLLRFIQKA